MIEIQNIFQTQKRYAYELKKQPLQQRQQQCQEKLRLLKQTIETHQDEILEALYLDFKKPPTETLMTEVLPAMAELKHTLRHLKCWTKPKKVYSHPLFLGTRSKIYLEPKGTVLIIAPWNYPFLLGIQPLISAIAAGNSVILKPSELTPNTSRVLKKILTQVFPSKYVSVIEGDKGIAQSLLDLPFDHIFFTGSTAVGRVVMSQAAKNLTPVTLELGGKSPVIIDTDLSEKEIDDASAKIIWGKILNLGQTCVAPDYVFVPQKILSSFTEKCLQQIRKQSFQHQPPTIINQAHHERLQNLLTDSIKKEAKISQLSTEITPTLVQLTMSQAKISKIMQEEIFGPILPIIPYDEISEAIEYIQQHDRPLALYLFSNQQSVKERILQETHSGGVCINDVIIHVGNHALPFGGIGASGMGQYHGLEGFRTFSHMRSVLERKYFSFLFKTFYPPYKNFHKKVLNFLIRYF